MVHVRFAHTTQRSSLTGNGLPKKGYTMVNAFLMQFLTYILSILLVLKTYLINDTDVKFT